MIRINFAELQDFYWAFYCDELNISEIEYKKVLTEHDYHESSFGGKPPQEIIESVKESRKAEQEKIKTNKNQKNIYQQTEKLDIGKLGQLPKGFQRTYLKIAKSPAGGNWGPAPKPPGHQVGHCLMGHSGERWIHGLHI